MIVVIPKNALTKIPQHVAVKVTTQTRRDISTNMSRPHHVRVEVNLTQFLRKSKKVPNYI